MRQATGYTGILSSSVLESAKLDRLEEIADEAIENGQKVVVFSNWTQMTTPAYERLAKKYSGAIITGEISTEERAKSVERFQNDDNCKFIIGTIGAMGTGLTITAGSVEVFLDEPWTMASKSQAIDRCHRIGAKSNITVYTLIAKGTVDERINEIVEHKGLLSDALIDGKIDKARQSELLDFLLS
jgi:SNF2 family DNA or RNA helicase